MALSRVKTWVPAEVLTADDLNAEFNNILANATALISPLTANLAAGGFDITGIDELQLNDAAADASAVGRLRRNGSTLTFHDGIAARRLWPNNPYTSTRAALPTTGILAGEVYRVTDDIRGRWAYTGSKWFGLNGEVANVKEFGAVGDGNLLGGGSGTDDTAAIQAAIDEVESNGGGIVYFPPGTYRITAALTIQRSGVILQGSGTARGTNALVGGSQLDATGAAITALSITDGDPADTLPGQVKVRDLAIVGRDQTNGAIGIRIDGVKRWSIEACTISNCQYGIYAGDTAAGEGAHWGQVVDCRISQIAGSAGGGIGIWLIDRCNAVSVVNTWIIGANLAMKVGNGTGVFPQAISVRGGSWQGSSGGAYVYGTKCAEINCDGFSMFGVHVEDLDGNDAVIEFGPNATNLTCSGVTLAGSVNYTFDAAFVGSFFCISDTGDRVWIKNQNIRSDQTAATGDVLSGQVDGDTEKRFLIEASGKQQWGPGGASALDMALERATGPVLKLTKGSRPAEDLRSDFVATLTTTDATITNLVSYALDDNVVYLINMYVVALEGTGTDRAFYGKKITAYRNGGGSVVTAADIFADDESAGAAGWGLTISASGNNVRVQATGAAATTVRWKARLDILSLTEAGA